MPADRRKTRRGGPGAWSQLQNHELQSVPLTEINRLLMAKIAAEQLAYEGECDEAKAVLSAGLSWACRLDDDGPSWGRELLIRYRQAMRWLETSVLTPETVKG